MKFTPKSEDELAREALLPAGVYPFEVLSATDALSKSGNEMVKLKLGVFGPNGEQAHVYDYLLEKMAFKLRHFAEATGLLARYEQGELTAFACESQQGYAKIEIEEQAGYAPRNVVKDYVKAPEAQPAAPSAGFADGARARPAPTAKTAEAAGGFDDDIPF